MNQAFNDRSLQELRATTVRQFRTGGGSRPDVVVVDVGGSQAVLKDYNRCAPLFGRIVGPLLCWREAKALVRLESLAGVPRLLARPDRRSLLVELLPGSPVNKAEHEVAWEAYFPKLSDLIDEMHALGVAHCDLRSPGNVLVSGDGRPAVVDFVSCFCRGGRYNFIANALFGQFCRVDQSAETKLKRLVAEDLLLPGESSREHVGGYPGQLVRGLGARIRDLSRALFAPGHSTKK